MISRQDYSTLMRVLLDVAGGAQCEHEFAERVAQITMYSYEINTDQGRAEHIDITDELRESMGQYWQAFNNLGIDSVGFVRYYIGDEMFLETGRFNDADNPVPISGIKALPTATLKAWAKGMTLAMRKYEVRILKDIEDGSLETNLHADNLGLSALVRQYMEEEVDETVQEFSRQLDSIFSVADIVLPPPKGGDDAHDLPAPPL
jgi:hypothetical protein